MAKSSTATVTWITWNNFGSLLQAFALQNRVEALGYQNMILSDYRITKIKEAMLAHKSNKIRNLLSKIKHILIPSRYYYNQEYKRVSDIYNKFRHEYLKIDWDWKESSVGENYDEYICGSDQIWTPSGINQPFYFLNFTKKKKIAYSVSIGSKSISKDFRAKIQPLVNMFSAISVREQTSINMIQPLTDKVKVQCTLDPTLLLTGDQWIDNLRIKARKSKEEYILVYLLTYNLRYIKLIKEFAKRKGLATRIFVVSPSIDYSVFDEQIYAGPREFVEAIYNSTCFFTDSFHGTVFSLLLHKKFYTLKRFSDKTRDNQNARIRNLLSILNLKYYFYDESNFEEVYNQNDINYSMIDNILERERLKSMNFLESALAL